MRILRKLSTLLLVAFVAFNAKAQNQNNNRVVVIPLFGDESTWQGAWEVDTQYSTADIVGFDGSSYIAVRSHTASLANIPPDTEFWEIVAASGATGATGAQGPQGLPGLTGPQGPAGPSGDVVSGDNATIFVTTPDTEKPNEKTLSGIVYTAGAGVAFNTPADQPNERVVTFDLPRVTSDAIDVRDPSLGVYCTIAMFGIFPSRSGADPFVGEISYVAALFSLIGTTYGGDGRTTFALPDARGRVLRGVGNGPGLAPVRWGQRGGSETVTPIIRVTR